MKAVFVFPPIWTKKSPSTGISSISGYLKEMGCETKIFDLNLDYYTEILTDKNYDLAFDYIRSILNKSEHSNIEKLIVEFYQKDEKTYNSIKNKVDLSIKQIQSEEYYDIDKYEKASFVVSKAMELISLPYYPYIIFDEKIENVVNQNKFEDYKKEARNENNIFYKYLNIKAEEIVKEKALFIGISINFEGQMLAGLTLAYILKTKFNQKVSLGGTHITRSVENIKCDNEFFDNYADFVMIGNGEIPSLKLIHYIEGKCSICDVPSLIYKENNEIKFNPLLTEQVAIDFNQDFDYTTDKNYFLPEKVYPINISKGCYWGKCTFCDFGIQYTQKEIDKVIKEIKFLKNKYNAKYFYLTDSALSPKTAKEFAKKLIEENLDIRWTTFLRFEKLYDKNFLSYLYKSGLRCVSWGLESASQRVLDSMNKGTNIDVIKRILKDSYEIGIANRLTVIYLFPTETYEDFCETINFLKDNKKYIFFIIMHRYILKRYSYIFNHKEEFGIDLNTFDVKSEYYRDELGIPYNKNVYEEKIKEMDLLYKKIYIHPDETMLYFSRKEK